MKHGWAVVVGVAVNVWSVSVSADTGKAVIKGIDEDSAVSGTATLTDTPEGLRISIEVSGVVPGSHGLHIHEFGDCSDQAKAAGSHYNPANSPHGFLPKDGAMKAHAGDMGNVEIGPDGSGSLSLVLPGVSLSSGTHTVGGRAIILHEKADDFGQPTGNAGGRIGCGVIVITGNPQP